MKNISGEPIPLVLVLMEDIKMQVYIKILGKQESSKAIQRLQKSMAHFLYISSNHQKLKYPFPLYLHSISLSSIFLQGFLKTKQ
uniref:Uncharacterized protein n=1 Tax=Solanum lycopersicum TaxID=4081 RepID=A0A3Q7H1E4_SOLLC